jgi:riboflavin kinase/FMN adenylyltransferase
MRQVGEELGFRVEVAPLLAEDGEKVGSSSVRQALSEGDVERVWRLLGRPFSLRGPVVTGDMRGRTLGFPTANIAIGLDRALPAYGIYVTRAFVRESAYESCTSIGIRPTFDVDPRPTVETFVLDFDEDVYGQEMRIELLARLRGEQKFDSAEALVAQMHRDIEDTRAYFRAHRSGTSR